MHHSGLFETGLAAVALAAWLAYLVAVIRLRVRGRRWSGWRTTSFTLGTLLLVMALSPSLVHFAHQDLRGHMLQHLLLGMFAPLGLVLAAPVTLTLKTLRADHARQLVRVLRTRPVHWLGHPVAALLLNVGAMYLLYLSPLYTWTLTSPVLHGWLHLHFLVAGCLFTWAIAGPDPGASRPSFNLRFIVLFLSMATHAALAKIMYAYHWPRAAGYSLEELQAAAQWMYYGGDLAEVLLLIALMLIWYQARPASRAYPAPGRSSLA